VKKIKAKTAYVYIQHRLAWGPYVRGPRTTTQHAHALRWHWSSSSVVMFQSDSKSNIPTSASDWLRHFLLFFLKSSDLLEIFLLGTVLKKCFTFWSDSKYKMANLSSDWSRPFFTSFP